MGFNAGNSLTAGSGNVCIGSGVLGVAGESNTTRIRNVYASAASGRAVYVNSDNKIGTLVSSRRFKDQIKPMDTASEAILALKPVSFRYKKEIEPNGSIMFGLIAEDVEKVDPDLVTRDDKGEAETVRYEAVNTMLFNEFLNEHRTVQEQGATICRRCSTSRQHCQVHPRRSFRCRSRPPCDASGKRGISGSRSRPRIICARVGNFGKSVDNLP